MHLRRLRNAPTIAILALAFPWAGLADVTGTATLTNGQSLDLDAGTVAASGGDISWNGGALVPQGSATALAAASAGFSSGASEFSYIASLGPTTVATFASEFSSSPIRAGSFLVGAIFLLKTNGGYYAVVLVTAEGQSSITLQFVTFTTSPFVPLIYKVMNNYSLIPDGFSNSGIALGSLFIIKGAELASSPAAVLQSSAAPGIPATLNGASVSVTVNGTTTHPGFYYATASQLALVMPSNTPTGSGAITVTYNGQASVPFSINVVASAFGFDTYYGTGSGLGVATNPGTGAYYDYSDSVPPGAVVTMWGSGLGADPTRDTTYSTSNFPYTINALEAVYVGGIQATIQYQGASSYPGVNQVNVLIPANAPTGCFVSVVGVSTNGPTNFVTLPIGTGECEDAGSGFRGGTLTNLTGMAAVNTGYVEMISSTFPATVNGPTLVVTAAAAAFGSYAGSTYGTSSGLVSAGSCIVAERAANLETTPTPELNAGTITISAPSGLAPVSLGVTGGPYNEQLSNALTTAGDMFQFQATGGTQIGSFTTSVNFPAPLLTWVNQSIFAAISRSEPLTVDWTGGAPGSYVFITGTSSSETASGTFLCLAPASEGFFAVPTYVLGALPAGTSNGSVSVGNQTVPQSFTAAGLDYGYAIGIVQYQIDTTYR